MRRRRRKIYKLDMMYNPMTIQTRVRKWGNSYGIVIPSDSLKAKNLKENEEVIVEIEKRGRIMASYFLDTYALIEIIKGNESYNKILGEKLFTSLFNLYELYYSLLRDYNEETARRYFFQFKEIIIPMKDSYIFSASAFKLKNKKSKFSYADCLGYNMALE